jgi:predicted dienelactone hydrolase
MSFLAVSLLLAVQEYKPIEGPFKTEFNRDLTITREGRDRPIEVRATWPVGPGPFPVIVMSHGMGGSKDVGEPLVKCWASNGYVVLAPTHLDSFAYMDADQRKDYLAGKSGSLAMNYASRPQDVSALIDQVGELEKQEPRLKGKMDLKHLAMAGHSFGAHTTMLIAGTKMIAGSRSQSFVDPRFQCALMLSPQGKGRTLTEESWKSVTIPIMVVSGTEDKSVMDRDVEPVDRQDPYKYAASKDKYLVWIEGANHGLGGISGNLRRQENYDHPEILTWVQTAALAFFDAYIKNDAKAKAYLASDNLPNLAKGKLTLKR